MKAKLKNAFIFFLFGFDVFAIKNKEIRGKRKEFQEKTLPLHFDVKRNNS